MLGESRFLYAFEWVAVLFVALVLGTLRWHGLAIDTASIPYTLAAMLRSVPLVLLFGFAGRAALDGIGGRGPLESARAFATPARLVLWGRLWLACWVTSFGYFWLKVCIPLVTSGTYDLALRQLDRALHLGFEPSFGIARLLHGAWLVAPLDAWYAGWLVTVVAGIAVFAASPRDAIRRGVVLSCVLLWTSGAVAYWVLPALGPALAFPDDWSGGAAMPRAEAAQALLAGNYQKLIAIRAGQPTEPFSHTLGVAAMPSLHVGFHFLFALWIRREVPRLFLPAVAIAALTFIGSVATGWHYAVDGYAGAALAWLCYRAACALEFGRDEPGTPTSPSP